MQTIYKFFLWFILTFVGTIFVHDLVPNDVVLSFIVALVVAFVAVKDD
jgi:hypothetical protein